MIAVARRARGFNRDRRVGQLIIIADSKCGQRCDRTRSGSNLPLVLAIEEILVENDLSKETNMSLCLSTELHGLQLSYCLRRVSCRNGVAAVTSHASRTVRSVLVVSSP